MRKRWRYIKQSIEQLCNDFIVDLIVQILDVFVMNLDFHHESAQFLRFQEVLKPDSPYPHTLTRREKLESVIDGVVVKIIVKRELRNHSILIISPFEFSV